jgi:hypothetical protein
MEFVGAADRIDNNWVLIDRSVLFDWATWNEDDFKKNHMDMVVDGHNKSAYMGAEARLLSFMANLDQKNAIGFSVRGRAIINFDNIPESAAILMFNGNNVDSLLTHHVFFRQSLANDKHIFSFLEIVCTIFASNTLKIMVFNFDII